MDNHIRFASNSIVKEVERINKYLKSFTDPLREFQSQLSSSMEMQKRLEASIGVTLRSVSDQYRKAYFETLQDFRNILESPIRRARELSTYYESSPIQSAVLEAQRNLQSMSASTLIQIHDQVVSALTEPLRQAQIYIRNNCQQPQIYAKLESIAKRFREYNDLLQDVNVKDIIIKKDGTVTLANDTVTLSEINEAVLDILSRGTEETSVQSLFNAVASKVKPIKRPIKAVILYFLLPYFISMLSTLTSPQCLKILFPETKSNVQEITKMIKKQTGDNYELLQLNRYRFVKVEVLNIRNKPTIKSDKIDEIYLGQVVQIINKKRHWTFIEYLDEITRENHSGWVFTRYLGRFKK